jgi:hypothetical protein
LDGDDALSRAMTRFAAETRFAASGRSRKAGWGRGVRQTARTAATAMKSRIATIRSALLEISQSCMM